MKRGPIAAGSAAFALLVLLTVSFTVSGASPSAPAFRTRRLAGAAGGTEPRITVDKDGTLWTVTNADTQQGTAIVFSSHDHGVSWQRAAGAPAGQNFPTIDVDIVTTRTGRIIASELDFTGINFPTSYSDDRGATWTASRGGTQLVDMDRQWLAVGPDDPTTHLPRVYLLFHNLFTGAATHNMWVMTSTDNGATFGPPIPITVPGSPAWLDLQCSDSGGPSSLSVDPNSGALLAVWGTRSSTTGGCGAQPLEINVVAATRVWVATSPDASAGSWTHSIAVDDSASGRIVGMQLAYGAFDRSGNVWVAYPESPNGYPDYDGAAIRAVWTPQDLSHWSAPITIAPEGGAGNVLPHIVAGDAGEIDVAYFHGTLRGAAKPAWHLEIAQSLDALSASPTITRTQPSGIPTYTGTASKLMGACGSGPLAGVENGFACSRSTDVWGITLDHGCNLAVVWPAVTNDAPGHSAGTYVSTQSGGASLCNAAPVAAPKKAPAKVLGKRIARGGSLASTGQDPTTLGLVLLLAAAAVAARLRRPAR